jgi:hypothetical protein
MLELRQVVQTRTRSLMGMGLCLPYKQKYMSDKITTTGLKIGDLVTLTDNHYQYLASQSESWGRIFKNRIMIVREFVSPDSASVNFLSSRHDDDVLHWTYGRTIDQGIFPLVHLKRV